MNKVYNLILISLFFVFSINCNSQSTTDINKYMSSVDSNTNLNYQIYTYEHAVYDSINDNGAVTAGFDSKNNLIRVKRKSVDDEKGKSYTSNYYYKNGGLVYFTSETYNVTKKSMLKYLRGDQYSGIRMYFKDEVLIEVLHFKNDKWVKEDISDTQISGTALEEIRLSEYFNKVLKSS